MNLKPIKVLRKAHASHTSHTCVMMYPWHSLCLFLYHTKEGSERRAGSGIYTYNTQIRKASALGALPELEWHQVQRENKEQSSEVVCTSQRRQSSNKITRKNNGF